jgi:hypothetical protein
MVGPGMSTCSAASQKYATDIIEDEKKKNTEIKGMKKQMKRISRRRKKE